MDKGKIKFFGRAAVLMCISATMIYASDIRINVTTMGIKSQTNKFSGVVTVYEHMSTSELEKEVERLTLSGEIPFEMGVELIKRWSRG